MKKLMSITTNEYDRGQYRDSAELLGFAGDLGFDGFEALLLGDAMKEILKPSYVTGVHLPFVNSWVDFWLQDHKRLLEEYGSWSWVEKYFGGREKNDFSDKLRRAVGEAAWYQPEYMVYHVCECTAYESVVQLYHYSDQEVIDASADFINSWCGEILKAAEMRNTRKTPEGKAYGAEAGQLDGNESLDGLTYKAEAGQLDGKPAVIMKACGEQKLPWLLFENLWHSGLNLRDPEEIPRLLEKVRYPKTGVMLDLGHLMHCNPEITGSNEGVDYIHSVLDTLPDLSVIKGIHLHHTLSGKVSSAIMEKERKRGDYLSGADYSRKLEHYYPLIYQIDVHRPFTSRRIGEIIDRIRPEFLVYELMASSKEEYACMSREQNSYFL